jgi:GTP pyrophosphokinase
MIKLAERLHNMRTVKFMDKCKRSKKAKETVELFMPLARKLENDKLIAELNDLSMKYL